MGIKRYYANKDNTITNAFEANLTTRGTGSNMGAADILEVFSIYGQVSSSSGLTTEKSRVITEFQVTEISSSRAAGDIPASGSVSFYYKLFNAKHGQTLPKQFNLVVAPISRSWTEGVGLDMENYSDAGVSNWISASEGTAWTNQGGDYYTGSSDPTASQFFDVGTEDLEVDVTEIVERQLKYLDVGIGAAKVYIYLSGDSASQYATGQANPSLTLTGTLGEIVRFKPNDSSTSTVSGTVGISGLSTTAQVAAQFVAAINDPSVSTLGITASVATDIESNGRLIKVEQEVGGTAGNTTIVGINDTPFTSSQANTWLSKFVFYKESGVTSDSYVRYPGAGSQHLVGTTTIQFFDGANTLPNYGLGVFLTSSEEDSTSRSYYTKKFFARSSEFFFKRPIIEARFAPTVFDDRGQFYYSSSLAPAADNLNTVYLYNRIRGRLVDIPTIGTGAIYVSVFSGSSTTPTGSALTLVADGTNVISGNETIVTGSHVSTGIYKATFAITAAATPLEYLHDVWHNGDLTTQFTTGTIEPLTFGASSDEFTERYLNNITNLKAVYESDETAQFRVYTRPRNWSPTIYTVANARPETTIIPSSSFSVFRLKDDLKIIPFGTGSDLETLLDYDERGNYFELDMGMLEPDYGYGIQLCHYNEYTGKWDVQSEVFKFRVEKRQSE
jgi:hypothetical protein